MKILLHIRNKQVINCSLGYIGMIGMQINSGSLLLDYGVSVDVEMTHPTENGMQYCKIPAVITHKSNKRVGLTFLFHDLESIEKLRALLETYLLQPVLPNAGLEIC